MDDLLTVRPYTPQDCEAWDNLVTLSAGGTFLFMRRYMEYHADRFTDHSLLVCRHDTPIALLPANRRGDTLVSHEGLTYGGLITRPETTTSQILDVFEALAAYLRHEGIKRLVYKCVPYIYQQYPHAGDLYALYKLGARRTACNLSATLEPAHHPAFAQLRRRCIKKAVNAGVTLTESDSYASFWEILSDNLHTRFDTRPVHSLAEIELLHARFPQQIRLHTALLEGETVAGTVVYDTGTVAHTQYISASPQGKATGALDLLFAHLINEVYASRRYFDFGISTEENGSYLNHGLMTQKEGFGARGTVYEIYEVTL